LLIVMAEPRNSHSEREFSSGVGGPKVTSEQEWAGGVAGVGWWAQAQLGTGS